MTSKNVLILILLAVAVYVGLVTYGDFEEVGGQLAHFPLIHLIVALGLAVANYVLRLLRWSYYLRVLEIDVHWGINILVFLSGLAMSITPAKAGELLKSYWLLDRAGIPVSRSAPVVVMERLTDAVSMVLLALVGIALLPVTVLVVLGVILGICGAAMAFIGSRSVDRLFSLPWLHRWSSDLSASRDTLRQLASFPVVLIGLILGAAAWFCEGLALWVILDGVNAQASLIRAIPIYAAATLVGGITTLPGGLVGTEGSMVALLQQSGIGRGAGSAGTLIVRLATLWFAVAIGLVALACLKKVKLAQRTTLDGVEEDREIVEVLS